MKKLTGLFVCLFIITIACDKNATAQSPGSVAPPAVLPDPPASVAGCKKCIVLAEQSQVRVAIADMPSKKIIWEWKPESSVKNPDHVKWFSNPSDAKVVYNGQYVLMSASGGGVALIRIADKKAVFYAYAGGNTHSAELLPDGNIVSASSTGNFLTLFTVDTLQFPDNVYKKNIPIDFGHNVVWDQQNQLLWTAAGTELKSFTYTANCTQPDLILKETIHLPGKEAHDLFPVYGENALWFTNTTNVYKINMATKALTKAAVLQPNIKSVSSGPDGFPVIIIKPKQSWWTDEVIDARGNSVFYQPGLKIYKARWVLPNSFSYPTNHIMKQCK